MKTYKYKNYDEYIKCQKLANAKKSNRVWAKEENIKFITNYMKKKYPSFVIGICHGSRGGQEQEWFMRNLPITYVFGTEIGEASPPLTVRWDFNIFNPKWVNKFDFVYSNSFDHAFDPAKTFQIWVGQVKSGGLIILEYDRKCEHTGEISKPANKMDPVSIRLNKLVKTIPKWSEQAKVIDVLSMPVVTNQWRKAIIVEVK